VNQLFYLLAGSPLRKILGSLKKYLHIDKSMASPIINPMLFNSLLAKKDGKKQTNPTLVVW
jgi:hypothetical protein